MYYCLWLQYCTGLINVVNLLLEEVIYKYLGHKGSNGESNMQYVASLICDHFCSSTLPDCQETICPDIQF